MTDHWLYLPAGLSYTCYYLASVAQVASWGPGQGHLGYMVGQLGEHNFSNSVTCTLSYYDQNNKNPPHLCNCSENIKDYMRKGGTGKTHLSEEGKQTKRRLTHFLQNILTQHLKHLHSQNHSQQQIAATACLKSIPISSSKLWLYTLQEIRSKSGGIHCKK